MRRARAEAVDRGLDGERIALGGFVLPLVRDGVRVTEFLFVPWVGACVHTPPPPPNQMIRVIVPGGMNDPGPFAAFRVTGRLEHRPAAYDLFHVDGTLRVNVAYSMTAVTIEPLAGRAMAAAPPPAPDAGGTWWNDLQARMSSLFTRAMTGTQGGGTAALLQALVVAFLYGVVHTLGPGHGKAIVVSYFVGEGGSLRRGLFMGAQIAIFHVLSAVVFVWATDFAVRQATGASLSDFSLVRMGSYAAIVLIGGVMLWRALRPASRLASGAGHTPGQAGCLACAAAGSGTASRWSCEEVRPAVATSWLAAAVGAVPCTGALLVLLFGIANDLLLPATLMVVAISAGMAVAMAGIGIVAILGRDWAHRRLGGGGARAGRLVQVAGAACVLLIGLGLLAQEIRHRAGQALATPSAVHSLGLTSLPDADAVRGPSLS